MNTDKSASSLSGNLDSVKGTTNIPDLTQSLTSVLRSAAKWNRFHSNETNDGCYAFQANVLDFMITQLGLLVNDSGRFTSYNAKQHIEKILSDVKSQIISGIDFHSDIGDVSVYVIKQIWELTREISFTDQDKLVEKLIASVANSRASQEPQLTGM